MKRLLCTIISLLFVLTSSVADNTIDEVSTLLKNGKTEEIVTYFGNEIELITLGERCKGKNQVNELFKVFLKNNSPYSFSLLHKGEKEDSKFVCGKIQSNKYAYRINIIFRKQNSDFLIHQIRITNVNE